jgi:hypothetical protein
VWTFNVKGTIPDAKPPDASLLTSSIDDRLSRTSREALAASKTALRR